MNNQNSYCERGTEGEKLSAIRQAGRLMCVNARDRKSDILPNKADGT
jgi:hypothetical protein